MAQPAEGVIKFAADHAAGPLDARLAAPVQDELLGWRAVLFAIGLVGRDPDRYEGAGFGNLSARVEPWAAPRGRRAFVITGSQTGGKPMLGRDGLCVVTAYDPAGNRVQSRGPVPPSSESMTHGAVYDVAPRARFVIHVHAPLLWRAAAALGLPATRPEVPYGTPAMAHEVSRLFRATDVRRQGLFVMGGHEDGVVAFGRTAREAGGALLDRLALAEARRAQLR